MQTSSNMVQFSETCVVKYLRIGALLALVLCLHLAKAQANHTIVANSWILKHNSNTTDLSRSVYNKKVDRKPTLCNLSVTTKDGRKFVSRVSKKNFNFAYLHLAFTPNISNSSRPDVFLPNIWVWTFIRPKGAFPYLSFDYDAGRLSFGLLEYYTLNSVRLNLKADPENCSLEFGEPQTTTAIATALGNMTLHNVYNRSTKLNYSIFCHRVKLDPFADGDGLFYFYTYFGYLKNLVAYSCCHFYRDNKADMLQIRCSDKTVEHSKWSAFFYFMGLIFFMYLPIPLSLFSDYILSKDRPTGVSEDAYVLNPQDINSEDAPLLTDRVNWEADPAPHVIVNGESWLYLGLDKPVTLMHLPGVFYRWLGDQNSVLVSRIYRLLLFSVIIPLPVYFKTIFYYLKTPDATSVLINASIPVGFLSIPYGFEKSSNNWLTVFGGPTVVLGFYLTIGQICICAPRNSSNFLFSVFKIESVGQSTLLSLNLSITERFGAVNLKAKNPYVLLSNLLKGNLYTILNVSFWKFSFRFLCDRFRRWFLSRNRTCIAVCILSSFYAILCVVEVVLCIIYYGCPSVFYIVNLIKAYLHHYAPRGTCKVLLSPFIIFFLLFSYYALFLIFIRGILFIILVLDYTYMSIVIYPHLAFGCVILFSTMLVFLSRNLQKLSESYLTIFYELVKINLKLESETETNDIATIRDRVIVLKNLDVRAMESFEIDGMPINFTKEQRQLLKLTRSSSNSSRKTSQMTSKFIRWLDIHPGIPSELFYYVVEKHHPLRVAFFVFFVELAAFAIAAGSVVTLIIAFHRLESFTLSVEVITLIVLTVLPQLNVLFTSRMEKIIQKEMMVSKLRAAVVKFYREKEIGAERQRYFTI